jgi:glucose/galactose transporter
MTTTKQKVLSPIIIIGMLFFAFGFITWINGTLIPYLKIVCELRSNLQSYLVATAFFIAYTVMAIPSSLVLLRVGYKKGMALGLLVMALGAIIFIPAAQARNYALFLTGLFIIGTGLALLQTASNPYISIIGPIESAAKRISIMGICNKVAGIIAGLIFGYITLKDADQLELGLKTMNATAREATLRELSGRVIIPYIIIAASFAALAVAILFSSLPDIKEEGDDTSHSHPASLTPKTSVFQFPHLILGIIALFLYVGVEVMAGDTIISYGKSLGIALSTARFFTQLTLIFMLVGYLIGIVAIPKYLTQQKALAICAVLGVLFATTAVLVNGMASVVCIALLGLANSLMWPAIFPLAINGLGKFTKIGSALLVMAIAGGAILPLLYGALSDSNTTRLISEGFSEISAKALAARYSYWIMIPCYVYIFYYAVRGHRIK